MDLVRLFTKAGIPSQLVNAADKPCRVLVTQPSRIASIVRRALLKPGEVLTNETMYGEDVSRVLEGEWIVSNSIASSNPDDPVVLYFHGGAHYFMSPKTQRAITARVSECTGMRTYVADYRLAPENLFPSAVEDALAYYLAITGLQIDPQISCKFVEDQHNAEHKYVRPNQVVIIGDSSGCSLIIQLMLLIRALRIEMPAAIVMMSPFLDHELKSASVSKNWNSDFMSLDVAGMDWALDLYSNGLPKGHPSVSPIHADLHGLPPILVQAGDSEILTVDAVEFHKKALSAGCQVELELFRDMFHVFQSKKIIISLLIALQPDTNFHSSAFPFLKESKEAFRRIGMFTKNILKSQDDSSDSGLSSSISSESSSWIKTISFHGGHVFEQEEI